MKPFLFSFLFLLSACSSAPPLDDTEVSRDPASPNPPTYVKLAANKRIIAIGDIHGSLVDALAALKLAGAVDEGGHWIGGDLIVVQLGDEIDRGPDDRKVLDLFKNLEGEAKKAGGAVYPLLGNHESMNVLGRFDYVNPASQVAFADLGGREHAFQPGQIYAKILAQRNVVMIIGDTVFLHGGLSFQYSKSDLQDLNSSVRQWLAGAPKCDGSQNCVRWPVPDAVLDNRGPLWTREFSDPATQIDCGALDQALGAISSKTRRTVQRMVIGHTIQPRGITSACSEKVWRIDVGMYHYHRPQVLEIKDGQIRVIGP